MGLFKSKEEKKKIEEEKLTQKALKRIKGKQKELLEFQKKEKEFYDKILKEKQKIKEELRTMAKLAIKDGKLQPVNEEEIKKMVEESEPSGSPFEAQIQMQQMQQPQQQQFRMQQPQPQYRQPQPQQRVIPQQQPYMPPQPPYVPPQEYEEPIQVPESQGKYTIQVVLTDKSVINVEVEQKNINDFLEGISEAIRDQAPFQIGNRILNGRYIMYFTF
jgi:hypothetical protein